MTNLLDIYIDFINENSEYIRKRGLNVNEVVNYLNSTGLEFDLKHALLIGASAEAYRTISEFCEADRFDEYQSKLYDMRRIEMAELES